MTATVSVVVPAYNNAEHIERTMRSILDQTFPDIEVIVADHSSTDDTWERLQQFAGDPRVRLLSTEAGGGALRNWNRVSQEARGEFLKLVCGDDLIAPELVAAQVAALRAHPSAVLSASRRDIVDDRDRPLVRGRGLGGLAGLASGTDAVRRTVVAGTNIFGEPGCVLMRREALAAIDWWDARFPYLIDQATYCRLLLEGDFVAINRSLASFRMSNSQWSVRLARSQADQAVAFHRWLRDARPDLVSALDVRRGNIMARLTATARRLAYVAFRRRMGRAS